MTLNRHWQQHQVSPNLQQGQPESAQDMSRRHVEVNMMQRSPAGKSRLQLFQCGISFRVRVDHGIEKRALFKVAFVIQMRPVWHAQNRLRTSTLVAQKYHLDPSAHIIVQFSQNLFAILVGVLECDEIIEVFTGASERACASQVLEEKYFALLSCRHPQMEWKFQDADCLAQLYWPCRLPHFPVPIRFLGVLRWTFFGTP